MSALDDDVFGLECGKLPDIVVGGNVPAYGINELINYKKDEKFSPNLWGFLTYSKKYYTNVFQDPDTGIYYIGLRDEQGIWCGAKLMDVFCTGIKAVTFSYPSYVTAKWNDVTKWFWAKYLDVGKNIYNLPEWNLIHDDEHGL